MVNLVCAGTVCVAVIVDVDMTVVVGVVRLKHEHALEIAEVAKAVICEGSASTLRFSSSSAPSAAKRRCLAEGAGEFPGRKT